MAVTHLPETTHSMERYETLCASLAAAQHDLAVLEVWAELEAVEPEGLGQNLLDFRFPPRLHQDIKRGVNLQRKILGTRALIAHLEQALEEWNRIEGEKHDDETPKESTKPRVLTAVDDVDAETGVATAEASA